MSTLLDAVAAFAQVIVTLIVIGLLHDIHLRLKDIERYIKGRCIRCGTPLDSKVAPATVDVTGRPVICAECR